MIYKEYFKQLFSQYMNISDKGVTEDIKSFKSDFFNLILDKLLIKEKYDEHFKPNRNLSQYDEVFLKEFFSFIDDNSYHEQQENIGNSLVRGPGMKEKRRNGHRIINGEISPFYKELVSLFLKLDKALFETETESLWLKSNQIFQDSLKSDYLEHTKTSISKIITKLEDLPAPFLIGLVDKFISPFTNFTKNFIYFLDSLNECKNQNYCSISTKPSENEVKNLAANILANLPQITNQTDIKIINSKINQLNNKAGYRKIKKERKILEEEKNNIIKNKLQSVFVLEDLPSDFHYQESLINDYETLAYLFPQKYESLLQEGIPNVIFYFNQKEKKCPYCAEFIKQEAIVCKFCHKELKIDYN